MYRKQLKNFYCFSPDGTALSLTLYFYYITVRCTPAIILHLHNRIMPGSSSNAELSEY